MMFFPSAHANGPQWTESAVQVALQLRAQLQMQPGFTPSVGVLYISEALLPQASAIMALVAQEFPQVSQWCGAVGGAVLGGEVSYGATAAIGGMLLQAAPQDWYVFSGHAPLSRMPPAREQGIALVHVDRQLAGSEALLAEVAAHLQGGQLLGGLSAAQLVWSKDATLPSAMAESQGVLTGGISGLALAAGPWLKLKTVAACRPMGKGWHVTRAQGNVVLELDGQAAMRVVLQALGLPEGLDPRTFSAVVHDTWVGLSANHDAAPQWSQLSGLDVVRRGLVLSDEPASGPLYLRLVQKDLRMAHSQLRLACAQIMEELTHSVAHPGESSAEAIAPRAVAGVLVVRSGTATALAPQVPMGLDTQLQMIRHAFGPVPVLGWEVPHTVGAHGRQPAGLQLLVFTQPLQWPSWA